MFIISDPNNKYYKEKAMPKGIEHQPKIETRLTAISLSCNGRKISTFLMLPVINGKTILSYDIKDLIEEDLGARRGDTIGLD